MKEDTVTDTRLALAGVLAQPGQVTEDLTVRYVFGSANDVADPLLTPARTSSTPSDEPSRTTRPSPHGDKFDYFPVKCGQKRTTRTPRTRSSPARR